MTKSVALVFAVLTLGLVGWKQRQYAALLETQLDARQAERTELDRLQRERDRLRTLQPSESELASLRRSLAAEAIQTSTASPAVSPTSPLPLGNWKPAAEWRNQGRLTPQAAVETALWSAAGGDTGALAGLLTFGRETRAEAEALRTSLHGGEQYASAEELVAALTINAIPVGDAQLVWLNQADTDHATVGLFLKNPPTPTGAADFTPPTSDESHAVTERKPPELQADTNTSVAYLSLQREADGWRIDVPPGAIDQLAKKIAPVPSR